MKILMLNTRQRSLVVGVACVATTAILSVAAPLAAAEIEGISFRERISVGDVKLVLNNVGLLRYRVFFRGYVSGLYLGEGVSPEALFDDVPKRLEIEYFWAIPAHKFAEATVDGIAANRSSQTASQLRPAIQEFNALYKDIKPGDRYALTYIPGEGTELAHNGTPLGTVPGAEFGSAVFSIWFGTNPFDSGLRDRLLKPRSGA